jgi:hypothetical protein
MTSPLTWSPSHGVVAFPDAHHLHSVERVVRTSDAYERPPKEGETLVVVLGGTHDLYAGSGSWAQRGTRATPFDGRACALYVPGRTPMAADGGGGELLFVAYRRPAPAKAATPERKPMLPLAGSNKVYDGERGDWVRLEDLPTSPEAVLPRRIPVRDVDGVRVEDVFAPDYKAAVGSLLEFVLQDGVELTLPPPAHAREVAVVYSTRGKLTIEGRDDGGQRDGVVFGDARPLRMRSDGGPTYVAVAFGGPKSQT